MMIATPPALAAWYFNSLAMGLETAQRETACAGCCVLAVKSKAHAAEAGGVCRMICVIRVRLWLRLHFIPNQRVLCLFQQ